MSEVRTSTRLVGVDFVSRLFQDAEGLVELRALRADRRNTQQIFSRGRDQLERFIAMQLDAKHDLYFGCATRTGEVGDKAHCGQITALWSDLDFKRSSEQECLRRLAEFPFPPSIRVRSGGGIHPYWLLREPADAHDPRVEPILRGIARTLDADTACAELARVLRLPGTKNFKSEYAEPRPVEIESVDWDLRYNLDDFEMFVNVGGNGHGHASAGGEFLGVEIPRGVNLEQALRTKLNLNVRHADGKTWFDYHGLRGLQGNIQPCLIQGSVHGAERDNPRECTFVECHGKFAHYCFDSDCRASGIMPDARGFENVDANDLPSKTRRAVYALNLETVLLCEDAGVLAPTALPDMPQSCLDGRLGEVYLKCLADFPVAYGWLSLLAGASALIAAQEWQPERTLPLNLYVSLVGPVHSGKSSCIERANYYLDVKDPILLRTKAGSAEGLLAMIGDRQGEGVLLFPDEISHLLEKSQISNASFSYILNSLFYSDTAQLTILKGKAVNFHARLSLIGGVVDEKFDESYGSATTSGHYDRTMFGLCPTDFKYLWRPIEGAPTVTTDVLFDAVPIERECWEARNEIANGEGINTRVLEISLRCAAICAAVDRRDKLRAKDLTPAWELARYQSRVREYLQPNPGKNFEAKIALRILGYLSRHASAGQWVRLRQVLRTTHAYEYGPSVVERALNAMRFGGTTEETSKTVGKGQKQRLIRLTGEGDS